jgi:Mn2+/Fe2+ NRAMP family transporter
MNSFVWLALIVVFVVVVVLTGRTPRGGKPVGRTRLMHSARAVLLGGIVVCAGMVLWSISHR